MGLTRIGEEKWDFVDRDGGETRLPSDPKAAVEFPTRWRVFGPTGADTTKIDWAREDNYLWYKEAIPQVDAAVQDLSAIPETLTVGDQEFDGRDAEMTGDTLDLSALFGGHEAGQQAYAMAEMEVQSETEVIFGTGCDWWMQWWIDGEPVLDTLATGNREGFPWSPRFANSRIGSTDHCFRRRLSAGRHLIVVRTISGQTAWVLRAGVATPRDETLHALPRSNRWEFLPDLNEIRPPALDYWTHTMAICPDLCFGDVTIECEFKQLEHSGNFGLIFGAQDSGRYYWAQIPTWGQLWRSRAFFAAISVADGSGHIRNLKMELMPNVPLHGNEWRTLKVERRGNRIQMWVAGVKGPCVTDDTYGAGRVGVGGFSRYSIRNLQINGRAVDCVEWPEGDRRGRGRRPGCTATVAPPWINPVPDLSLGDFQHPWQLLKVSEDEVIMPVVIGRDKCSNHRLTAENSAVHFYHSLDAGRSWSQYAGARPTDAIPHASWYMLQPGVIRAVEFDSAGRRFTLRDSTDKGLTWSEPQAGKLLGDWDRVYFQEKTTNELLGFGRLRDGTLMAPLVRHFGHLRKMVPDEGMGTWGTGVLQRYCTMSKDEGLTWSEPVPMDHAAANLGDEPDSPCGDCSETPVAQLPSGRIVALSRPHRSPFMWQTHSDDGGRSWRVSTFAPFSGHGAPVLVATRSGYLAHVARGPGLGLHCSFDEGVNWDEGTMIDFHTSFNGRMIEVEPDVVLVAYPQSMDEVRPSLMRVQRIRITPDGPVPLGTD